MLSTVQLFFSSIVVSLALSLIIRARRRSQLGLPGVRGPLRNSWLTGHDKDIRCQPIAGENEMRWTKEYGLVVRIAGCFGQDNLYVADPKALQYIFHTSGYRFPKTGDMLHMMESMVGPSVVAVDGEEHRRQRHILNPAFSMARIRTYVSLFQAEGEKLTERLEAHLAGESVVVDILTWTTKVTLDVMGLSSFRHAFGSLDGEEGELASSLKLIMVKAFTNPGSAEIAYAALLRLLPNWLFDPLDVLVASRTYTMLKKFRTLANTIGNDIIQKAVDNREGLEEKDIVGILASSRLSTDSKKSMSQHAMTSQMVTFIAAGQDTASNTLGSLLYELARNPGMQDRLRGEIRQTLEEKNGEPLSSTDYDALPFLNACIKETLRLHPVAHSLIREASQDDILPLSEPLILEDGSTCTQIPIKKGQVVYTAILVYNRLKSLWGEDADVWNPDRFLRTSVGLDSGANVGVYANLLTFGAGNRACIGWRFALMELQVFTALLVNKFSFEPDAEVMFAPGQITVFPVLEGKYEEGMNVPLKVTSLY